MAKNRKEIKEVLDTNTAIFDLVFVGKLMKTMELSLKFVDKSSDDYVAISDYINMLYTELTVHLTTEEIEVEKKKCLFNKKSAPN